jgi:hypothetical protein
MKVRQMRDGDKEYFRVHLRSEIANFLASSNKDFWEMVKLEEIDHVLVIEDVDGNCGSLMLIRQIEGDDEKTAYTWLIPGEHVDKNPIPFLRLTYKELGHRLLDAGPYQLVWSYVDAKSTRNIEWATRWMGAEIVERDLDVEGFDTPRHKVVLTRELLAKRRKAANPSA